MTDEALSNNKDESYDIFTVCKESRVQWLRISGFCNQASEFCSQLF